MKKYFILIVIAGIFFACEKNLNESEYKPTLFPIETGDSWGYINAEGDIMIEPQYEYARSFYNGSAAIKENGKWGFINEKGEKIIEAVYEQARSFTPDGIATVQLNEKYGFINRNGDVIIDFEYDYSYGLYNGYAIVIKEDKYGIINTNGEIIVPIEYDNTSNFSEHYAFVATGTNIWTQTWAMIDENGEFLTDFIFNSSTYRIEDPLTSSIGIISPPRFREELAHVVIDNKYCYINTSGDVVLETDFDYIYQFSEGLAYVCKDGLLGFIDKNGNIVIEPAYKSLHTNFKDGYAPVMNDEAKYGIIDKNNLTIIPFEYTSCENFYGGLARVSFDDGSWGYIDIDNTIIWQSEIPATIKSANSENSSIIIEDPLKDVYFLE